MAAVAVSRPVAGTAQSPPSRTTRSPGCWPRPSTWPPRPWTRPSRRCTLRPRPNGGRLRPGRRWHPRARAHGSNTDSASVSSTGRRAQLLRLRAVPKRRRRDDPSRWPDAGRAAWRRGRRPVSQRRRVSACLRLRAGRGTTVPAHGRPTAPPGLREHGGTPPPLVLERPLVVAPVSPPIYPTAPLQVPSTSPHPRKMEARQRAAPEQRRMRRRHPGVDLVRRIGGSLP